MKAEREQILTEVAEAAAAFKSHAVYLHPESSQREREEFIADRSRLSEALCRWRTACKTNALTSRRVKG